MLQNTWNGSVWGFGISNTNFTELYAATFATRTRRYWANGSDDTSSLRAILASTDYNEVIIHGTAVITNELVLRQGGNIHLRLADNSGAIVNAAGSTNGRMLVNHAALNPNRTVADGAITAGTNVLTSATGSFTSADVGRTVVVQGAGWGALGAGAGPFVADIVSITNATTVVLTKTAKQTVSAASCSIYARDENIILSGGSWDRGAVGGSLLNTNMLFFRHVDGIYCDDILALGTAGKYAFSVGDCTHIRGTSLKFDYASDGFHVTGPATDVLVRDVTGYTHDDSVPVMTSDADICDNDVQGDIDGVYISNVNTTSAAHVTKLLGGKDLVLQNAVIEKIKSPGCSSGCMLMEDTVYGTGLSTIKNVTIRDLYVNATTAQVFANASVINNLKIDNVQTVPGSLCHLIYQSVGTITGLVADGLFNNGVATGSTRYMLAQASGTTLSNVSLKNIVNKPGGTVGGVALLNGTFDNVDIDGLNQDGVAIVFNVGSTAVPGRLSLDNAHICNGSTLLSTTKNLPLTLGANVSVDSPTTALITLPGGATQAITIHGERIAQISDATTYRWWNITASSGTACATVKSFVKNLPPPYTYALYSSTKTYAVGDRVFVNSGTKYFQSLQNGNIGHTPPASGSDTYWSLLSSGSAQRFTDGGTAPVAAAWNTDLRGRVTLGSGSPTTITVHFNTAFANAPHVTVMPVGNTADVVVTSTTTGFTVSSSATFTSFSYKVEHME